MDKLSQLKQDLTLHQDRAEQMVAEIRKLERRLAVEYNTLKWSELRSIEEQAKQLDEAKRKAEKRVRELTKQIDKLIEER